MTKVKSRVSQKIAKPCINCFAPVYLKFNYTYIDRNAFDLSLKYKAQIFKRMLELSSDTLIVLSGRDKKTSFEYVDQKELKIRKPIPAGFVERFPSESTRKLAIVRLYPNNNPIVGRLIGIIIKNIFYVFFIDTSQKLYHH